MKFKKRTLVSLSIAVGVAILATTAVVGAVSDTPYTQLKTAVKTTVTEMTAHNGNSTTSTEITIKDNGVLLFRSTELQKSGGNAYESSRVYVLAGSAERREYSFNNERMNIWYDQSTDTYYVNEFGTPIESRADASGNVVVFGDEPEFRENWADIERIVDALVGNLKDYVAVSELPEGGKVFSGALTEAQIPALVNAIASFATKQYLQTSIGPTRPVLYDSAAGTEMRDPDANASAPYGMPILTGDIFVKSVSGTAKTLPDGVLTDIAVSAVLSGTDEDGNVHDLSLDLRTTVTGLGTTVVSEPDLTGKKVQVTKSDPVVQNRLTEAFVGTYRNDAVVLVDGKFTKIGERTIVIESVTADTVTGRYYETYLDGTVHPDPLSFEFTAPNVDYYSVNFEFTGRDGTPVYGSIGFDPTTGTATFMDPSSKADGSYGRTVFPRVFD